MNCEKFRTIELWKKKKLRFGVSGNVLYIERFLSTVEEGEHVMSVLYLITSITL